MSYETTHKNLNYLTNHKKNPHQEWQGKNKVLLSTTQIYTKKHSHKKTLVKSREQKNRTPHNTK